MNKLKRYNIVAPDTEDNVGWDLERDDEQGDMVYYEDVQQLEKELEEAKKVYEEFEKAKKRIKDLENKIDIQEEDGIDFLGRS